MAYLRWLEQIGREQRAEVGGKAAALGELARAGFPVPDGFVLTTGAFQVFRNNGAARLPETERDVLGAPLPIEVAALIQASAKRLGQHPLAVRSSAIAEDLDDASFAGQYETVLNVQGADGVAEAVRRCWASCFSQRVAAYRKEKGHTGPPAMALLVQRMVPATAAGVAFTANPVTGDREEVLVSAVRGLGDRLVSGEVSPDEWSVRGDQATCLHAPEQAIDAAQALAVAELARRVERHFGAPQDVEWALAGGELYLLQARPITALPEPPVEPVPVRIEVPPGFWWRDVSHFPQPFHPMTSSIFLDPQVMPAGFARVNEEFGLLIEGMEIREIGGWPYSRMVPLGGKERPAPPAWLMWLSARIVPQVRKRLKNAAQARQKDTAGQYIEAWHCEWRPGLKARIDALRSVNLPALSDDEFDQLLTTLIEFLQYAWDLHMKVHAGIMVCLAELAFACRDLLDWDDHQVLGLLVGLSEKSSEPSRRLAELARLAGERPAVEAVLKLPSGETLARLAEVDAEFAAALDAYLHEYGCRGLTYELGDASLAESPGLVLGLVRDQAAGGYDPQAVAASLEQKRQEVVAEARSLLAERPREERERFERALARAERAYPAREDSEFYTASAPLALARYGVLELGHRLAERGVVAGRDDVFFLEVGEARTALRQPTSLHALVTRRKGERRWVEGHPGPPSYGKPAQAPPSFAALPPAARFMHEAMMWNHERIFAVQAGNGGSSGDTALVRGIAASPGRYTGTVRVIMSEHEFGKLQPGDVLVCPITSPVWSVLFPSVGALVTDSGGVLSHSAIIAREYRVPAVVATGNATALLQDRQTVTVDGRAGTVELVQEIGKGGE